MIHNAWSYTSGNADDLRKAADDLETISRAAAEAYRASVSIDDETLDRMLAEESWIAPQDAVNMGFATGIEDYGKSTVPAASARTEIMARMCAMPDAQIPAAVDEKKLADALLAALKEEAKTETFMRALMRRKEK